MITLKSFLSLLCLLFLLVVEGRAQNVTSKETEVWTGPLVSANFAYVLPKGTLGKMFDPYLEIGGEGTYKTKKNYLFGIEGNYFFGSQNLKKEYRDEILQNMLTSSGFVMGSEAVMNGIVFPSEVDAGILASNVGFSVLSKFGKLFPFQKKNPNSGLVLMGGLGYTQSRILYQSVYHIANQLQNDYAKGYDRKSMGILFRQMLAYWFMSNNSQYFNFYVGFETGQSLSFTARPYQFDLMKKDDRVYKDFTYSIKIGWMIPIGGRASTEFFYH